MEAAIHIGTSGWSYQHWRQVYYPHRLGAAKWLAYYTQSFSVTEINGSFYRLPSEETVVKWTQQVPNDFLFCPKMSRYLTHMKKLNSPEEPLQRFFSVFASMKHKMGPILIQLPPMLPFNQVVVEYFFSVLKVHYSDYRFVLEVRHTSWLQKKCYDLMKAYDIGFVISQSEMAFPYAEVITSRDVYVRFHGPKELYASSYPDAMLEAYAKKFLFWKERGKEVWVFFNNDINCYAIQDAKRLQELVKK
jgi:uncharacterized protein YecE (DUF72 family)